MINLRSAAVISVGLLSFASCGDGDTADNTETCPASVTMNQVTYSAAARYGVPRHQGKELLGVTTVSCSDESGRPVEARAIKGIPVSLAFYAPAAFGPEYIVIRDGESLSAEQLEALEK